MLWPELNLVTPLHKEDLLSHSNECEAPRNFLSLVIYKHDPMGYGIDAINDPGEPEVSYR